MNQKRKLSTIKNITSSYNFSTSGCLKRMLKYNFGNQVMSSRVINITKQRKFLKDEDFIHLYAASVFKL
jgi:hypothetical protein